MNDTPIYDAVKATLSEFVDFNSQITSIMHRIKDLSPENRERWLHNYIIENSTSREAAQYLISKLKLEPMDSKTKLVFGSWQYETVGYSINGKKQTATDILLKGIPSCVGSHFDIIAAEDGIVVEAGRCYVPHSREGRRKLHITMAYYNDMDKHVRYNRIGTIKVEPGDKVCKGQVIGIASGKDGCVEIDVRRNGRRLDAAEWLGIEVKR